MKRVTKDQLLKDIRADRARFDEIISGVPPGRLSDPMLPGGWSLKDVLAHIAWADREAVAVIEARALVGSELSELSEDELNEAVVRQSRSRSEEAVLHDYRASFDEYLSAIERLSEEDLNEPERFHGLTERIPGRRPWRELYDPGHYDEHGRTIETTLADLNRQD